MFLIFHTNNEKLVTIIFSSVVFCLLQDVSRTNKLIETSIRSVHLTQFHALPGTNPGRVLARGSVSDRWIYYRDTRQCIKGMAAAVALWSSTKSDHKSMASYSSLPGTGTLFNILGNLLSVYRCSRCLLFSAGALLVFIHVHF